MSGLDLEKWIKRYSQIPLFPLRPVFHILLHLRVLLLLDCFCKPTINGLICLGMFIPQQIPQIPGFPLVFLSVQDLHSVFVPPYQFFFISPAARPRTTGLHASRECPLEPGPAMQYAAQLHCPATAFLPRHNTYGAGQETRGSNRFWQENLWVRSGSPRRAEQGRSDGVQ